MKAKFFGTAIPSESVTLRYRTACFLVLDVLRGSSNLTDGLRDDMLTALSEFRGMVNRCIKRDQWDWFTVYTAFGEPNRSTLHDALGLSVHLRTAVKESVESAHEFLVAQSNANPALIRSVIDMLTFFLNGMSMTFAPTQGRLTIFSDKYDKGTVRLTLSKEPISFLLDRVNTANENFSPFQTFLVSDLEGVRLLVPSVFAVSQVRGSFLTCKVDPATAAKQYDLALSHGNLLLRRG